MESWALFCTFFSGIDWLWYIVAVVITYVVGALWFSVFFRKAWMRVFKIETNEKITTGLFLRTMGVQVLVNALFGLVLFLLVEFSVWLALLVLIAFCGWQKGILNFQFARWKEYVWAAMIQAGYTFVTGGLFILFALN